MFSRFLIFMLFVSFHSICFCLEREIVAPGNLLPKKYILSIGIQEFSDPTFKKLSYAKKDAQEIFSAFKNAGFNHGNLLINKAVMKKDIRNSLSQLTLNLKESDELIIYISSHGTRKIDTEGLSQRYIVTSDSSAKHPEHSAFSYNDLIKIFNDLKPNKKALILAFCHSGEGKSSLSLLEKKFAELSEKNSFVETPIEDLSEGSFIYAAANQEQSAFESHSLRHDVYTYFLLKGLSHSNNETLSQAHSYATDKTRTFVYKKMGKIQIPTSKTKACGSPIICIKKGGCRKKNSFLYFPDKNIASKLTLSIDEKTFQNLEKGIEIKPGIKKVTISKNSDILFDGRINFKQSNEYTLDSLLNVQPAKKIYLSCNLHDFENGVFKKNFAPSRSTGLGLQAQLNTPWEGLELGLAFIYYKPVTEIINYHHYSIKQKRSIYTNDIFLSVKSAEKAYQKSFSPFSLQLAFNSGVSILGYHSNFYTNAFKDKRQDGYLIGPTVAIESRIIFHRLGINIASQVASSYYANGFDIKTISYTARILIGKSW